jgi:hypothetical protein
VTYSSIIRPQKGHFNSSINQTAGATAWWCSWLAVLSKFDWGGGLSSICTYTYMHDASPVVFPQFAIRLHALSAVRNPQFAKCDPRN